MNDPWADERKRAEIARGYVNDGWPAWNWHVYSLEDAERLLADAGALLAMVPFARHKKECQIARAWGLGPGGTFTDPHCNCGFENAHAALPEHLKGDNNERPGKA